MVRQDSTASALTCVSLASGARSLPVSLRRLKISLLRVSGNMTTMQKYSTGNTWHQSHMSTSRRHVASLHMRANRAPCVKPVFPT